MISTDKEAQISPKENKHFFPNEMLSKSFDLTEDNILKTSFEKSRKNKFERYNRTDSVNQMDPVVEVVDDDEGKNEKKFINMYSPRVKYPLDIKEEVISPNYGSLHYSSYITHKFDIDNEEAILEEKEENFAEDEIVKKRFHTSFLSRVDNFIDKSEAFEEMNLLLNNKHDRFVIEQIDEEKDEEDDIKIIRKNLAPGNLNFNLQ